MLKLCGRVVIVAGAQVALLLDHGIHQLVKPKCIHGAIGIGGNDIVLAFISQPAVAGFRTQRRIVHAAFSSRGDTLHRFGDNMNGHSRMPFTKRVYFSDGIIGGVVINDNQFVSVVGD
ncbi:hypothetical protein AK51_20735 [Serratia nematodiphila DZ0503SBS1]|nr:hypothetical protein AK51_20735 [Serratia nematodiphila DZ0503SBS1]